MVKDSARDRFILYAEFSMLLLGSLEDPLYPLTFQQLWLPQILSSAPYDRKTVFSLSFGLCITITAEFSYSKSHNIFKHPMSIQVFTPLQSLPAFIHCSNLLDNCFLYFSPISIVICERVGCLAVYSAIGEAEIPLS